MRCKVVGTEKTSYGFSFMKHLKHNEKNKWSGLMTSAEGHSEDDIQRIEANHPVSISGEILVAL